jgi:hypothetical protein
MGDLKLTFGVLLASAYTAWVGLWMAITFAVMDAADVHGLGLPVAGVLFASFTAYLLGWIARGMVE